MLSSGCSASTFFSFLLSPIVRTVVALVGGVEETQVDVVVSIGLAGAVVGGIVEGGGAGKDPGVLELWVTQR